MKILLPFHSYQTRARQLASRRLVNCYAEQAPPQGKAPVALQRAPGIRSLVTLPTGPVRGLCVHRATLYAVSGSRLYSVTRTGGYTNWGSIPGTGRVSMASNGLQLIIVAPPAGYVYSSTLAQITDEDFTARGGSQVSVCDGFACFITEGSEDVFHSDYLDATSYDGLSFAPAGGPAPDTLNAILTDHRQLFLFGPDSVELWYNTGSGSGSPFAREQNGVIEQGRGAPNSPAKADNTLSWFTNVGTAVRLNDLTPVRISTHALEQRWAEYDRVDDAYGFTYAHEGHLFYCLTFPTGGDTFTFDIATGEWSERRSRVSTGGDSYWRVASAALVYGATYVGDSRSGAIGVIDGQVYTEFGGILRMEWTYPHVYAEGRRAFHHRLQIEVQSGMGLNDGQGEDPEIMLYVSDDGGMTFDAQPGRSAGAIGQYRWRSTWNRLGCSDDRVYQAGLRQHLHTKFKGLIDRIESSKDLSADDEKALVEAIEDFRKNGAY